MEKYGPASTITHSKLIPITSILVSYSLLMMSINIQIKSNQNISSSIPNSTTNKKHKLSNKIPK
jgi:hypothetical protein